MLDESSKAEGCTETYVTSRSRMFMDGDEMVSFFGFEIISVKSMLLKLSLHQQLSLCKTQFMIPTKFWTT